MKIDKELYRKAYEAHRQWSEAKMLYRAQLESRLSPQEAWGRYVALWEFCAKLAPPQTELQHRQHWAEWDDYYAKIIKLEAWRRTRGQSA